MSILNKVFKNKDEKEQQGNTLTKEKEEILTGKSEPQKSKTAFKHLKRPLLTEKGTALNKDNKYIFKIDGKANKIEVKKAIKEIYGIMPQAVNIINIKGKKIGMMRRTKGKRSDVKKAVVTLKKGESINIFEGQK